MTLRGCRPLCLYIAMGFGGTGLSACIGCGWECRTLGGHLYEQESHCFHPLQLLDDACGQQVEYTKKGTSLICLVSPEGDVYLAFLGDSERVRTSSGWRSYPVGRDLVTDAATVSLCRETIASYPGHTQCPSDAGISATTP